MNNNERADTVCSTGEFDEDETPFVEQLKRRKKRTKPLDSPPPTKKTLVDNIQAEPTNPTSNIHKPPPIFLKYNCTSNYIQLCKDIQENIQPATFKTKSGPKHLIILTDTPDGYRAAVKYLRNVKIEFHTFQPKEEKPFRVVIRGLHHTVPVELIKTELEKLGFKIRNVSNVIINRHGTKIPRPLFFVDLEANENNQNIFEVRSIMLGIVSVEEPYKKTEIPQCQNCQQYGHTKGYCNYGPKCVKCGRDHHHSQCTKPISEPPTCALCGESHPANYRGCTVHTDLQNKKKTNQNSAKFSHSEIVPPAPWKTPVTRSQDPALSFPPLPANTASLQHFEHPSQPQPTQPVLQQENLPPKQQQEQLSIQPQWRPQRPYQNSHPNPQLLPQPQPRPGLLHQLQQQHQQAQPHPKQREQPLQQLRSGLQHAQQHQARPQQQLPQLRIQQHRPQSDPQILPSNMTYRTPSQITPHISEPDQYSASSYQPNYGADIDYVTYRADHPANRPQGGTAILIKRSLPHSVNTSYCTDSIQATSLSLTTTSFQITIASVYCPPNKSITQNEFLSLFRSFGRRFVAGGDFNSKHPGWGCRVTNPRGMTLHNAISTTNYAVLSPTEPTYWPTDPNRLPDLLDFFVTSNIRPIYSSVSTLTELSSDHDPVLLLLDTKLPSHTSSPSLINGPVDWNNFQQILNDNLSLNISLKTSQEIDDSVHYLTHSIQKAVWDSTRPRPPTSHHTSDDLPLTIRCLISKKRRARALWQRTRYPSDKQTLNRLTRKLNNLLKQYKIEQYNSFTASLTTEDKSLWTTTKRILSYKPFPPPLKNPDGTWAKSDSEIANLFGTHLSNIFVPHPDNPDPTHTRTVLNDLDSPLPMSVPPPAFSPSEVKYAISKLPTKKAPGFDLITSTILRQLPKKAILFLTYIYNSVLRTTYFPLLWKFSQIKMIPKPNKPAKLPSSYRPISLLPLLGKLLEKLLYKRLVILLDPIIPDHQFGFRNSHSTIQQCQRVVDNIASCLEQKQYCSAAFLDVAQAFDRVWHQGLLWKIKSLVPSTYYLILLSYLSDRSFIVIHGSSQSSYFPIKAGVPQGSILSPLLYSVYTSDIPEHPATLLASFADDTAILSTNSDPTLASLNLQSHLTTLQTWCSNWKIRVNPQKCVHVTFTLRHSSCPPVYWHRTQLPPAKVVRYLGLYIDRTLTWNPHTRLKRQETNRRYKLLQRLLDKRSKLRTENKLLVYNSIIKPIWAYGAEIWGSAKPSNVKRIQTLQSKILRRIVDAPPYVSNLTIHTDLKIPFVKDFIATRYRKFHSKLYSHSNPLVKKLSSTTLPDNPPRRLKRHWPRDFLQMDL
ncbi:hypothetical protein AAG570_003579 [Ranatra chinensis]|uniref:Reverse transcriptase domain-containing protein n=1 Tax=Ranatra chinensis TaxID=642074 RepID=A0ABD0YSL2_9HEMI